MGTLTGKKGETGPEMSTQGGKGGGNHEVFSDNWTCAEGYASCVQRAGKARAPLQLAGSKVRFTVIQGKDLEAR